MKFDVRVEFSDFNIDKITDEAMKRAVEDRAAAVRRLTCPEHGEHPKNVRVQKVGRDYEIAFDPCCDSLREAALKAAGAS